MAHYRIAVLLLVLVWSSGDAQQAYNEQDQLGYSCSAGGSAQCQAYAAYRALAGDTLSLVGQRFGLSEEQVATASNLRSTTTEQLATGQWLLIPLNCSCLSGRSQYNTSYIIQQDDTYFLVSTNTFQGLTTDDAVGRANPSFQPNRLKPGDKIIFPIRCSCPARNQSAKTLLTYPVGQGDSLGGIAGAWNVSQTEIQSENRGVLDSNLQAASTLLLPITRDPPQLPKQQSAAPPVTPPSAPPVASGDGDGGSSKTGTYVGIAVGASAAVVLAVLAGIFWRSSRRKKKPMPEAGSSKNGAASDAAFNSNALQHQEKQHKEFLAGMEDLVDSEKPIIFSYEELRAATDGFSPSHLLQGSVYRGLLREELLAIKKMKGGRTTSLQELKILWKVHHSNLVRLVGMCSRGEQLFLVYEYADNGSLSSCLHTGKSANPKTASSKMSSAYLSWNTRLQIALDVAAGLEYIHDYTKPGLVHKDIKSSNILLDSGFRAKIANFGLARLAENNPAAPALTKHIAGTQGYMAPEYLEHGFISTKVDVYAFGVVLLELLTGREPILSSGSDDLAQIIVKLMDESGESGREHKIERLRAWVDPVLENAVAWDCALRFALLARSCVDDDPRARPSMKEVTFALSKMLESSLQWETAAVLERQQKSTSMEGR